MWHKSQWEHGTLVVVGGGGEGEGPDPYSWAGGGGVAPQPSTQASHTGSGQLEVQVGIYKEYFQTVHGTSSRLYSTFKHSFIGLCWEKYLSLNCSQLLYFNVSFSHNPDFFMPFLIPKGTFPTIFIILIDGGFKLNIYFYKYSHILIIFPFSFMFILNFRTRRSIEPSLIRIILKTLNR